MAVLSLHGAWYMSGGFTSPPSRVMCLVGIASSKTARRNIPAVDGEGYALVHHHVSSHPDYQAAGATEVTQPTIQATSRAEDPASTPHAYDFDDSCSTTCRCYTEGGLTET